MYNLTTIKFYTKLFFLQRNGTYFLNKPRSSFGIVEEFKHLRTTLSIQNSIQEEIKSKWKSGNACYYFVQNLLAFSWLSKNIEIKIYRNIILPVVLYGCETLSLTSREERRLRLFENMVLRRIFGSRRGGENYIKRNLMMLIKIQPDATVCRYLFTANSLYMFRVSQHDAGNHEFKKSLMVSTPHQIFFG